MDRTSLPRLSKEGETARTARAVLGMGRSVWEWDAAFTERLEQRLCPAVSAKSTGTFLTAVPSVPVAALGTQLRKLRLAEGA